MGCCDTDTSMPLNDRHDFVVGVLGNPNCGKTTLFNALTGARQRTGNWPGVTVERKEGRFEHDSVRIDLIDLPGVYSLDPSHSSMDELVARNYIMHNEADVILNVIDASNLERNLYLTVQLVEMRVPVVVALNMTDVAKERGIQIDREKLAALLGCPVVDTVASRRQGINELKNLILQTARSRPRPVLPVSYGEGIENALKEAEILVNEFAAEKNLNSRWVAVQILEGAGECCREAGDEVSQLALHRRRSIEEAEGEDIDILIADTRYGVARTLSRDVMRHASRLTRTTSDHIDAIVLNRWLGVPIFLLVMYLLFTFTINIGGALIDFFDIVAGTIFIDGTRAVLDTLGSPEWLTVLLADGIGAGIQVVATFIPIIGFLYLFLSFLEGWGYMSRAAFVMDRFMRSLGLPGKAFVPLIVGFGCNVPAIMAARTLDNPRERILTVMMAPFMSCGARLSVYALFAAAFFPVGGQNMVMALYVIGILFAMLTAFVLKKSLLRGEVSPFIMELPSYHIPTLKNVLLHTWERLKGFISDAGKIIVIMVVVINFLNSVGTDGSFGNEDSDKSVLSAVGRTIQPVFAPMGISEENWPATVGIFTGLLAKEVVVGALDAMYSNLAGVADDNADEVWTFKGRWQEAVGSVENNLSETFRNLTDPLGLRVLKSSESVEEAASEQSVHASTFGAMAERFDGKAGAFAYLLFVLLYAPCVAATSAIFRETTSRWTMFAVLWSTGLAFMSATIFYQAATFELHPVSSLAWIVTLLALFVGVFVSMRLLSNRNERDAALIAAQ
jgi:ferrous iron transport protein B